MSVRIDISRDELRKLDRALAGWDARLERMLVAAINDVGKQATANARAMAPVDTGRMKYSINQDPATKAIGGRIETTVNVGGDTRRSNWVSSRTGRNDPKRIVDYAQYVEYGTSTSPAQPFMGPAADRARGPLVRAVKAAIRKA